MTTNTQLKSAQNEPSPYSPGPWWLENGIVTANCPNEISTDFVTLEICEVFNEPNDHLNVEPDGDLNLILAAPDMLEALQKIHTCVNSMEPSGLIDLINNQGLQAINKARPS